jgi:restriction system protein
MSVFDYKNYCDPKDSFENNPHQSTCPYCKSKLESIEVKDRWHISNEELLAVHEDTIISYKEIHDLEDCYLNLRMDTQSFEIWVDCCLTCGWWRLVKDVCICAEQWQMWDIFFGCVGTLKNLSVDDLSTPIDEINNYLVAKYEDRFSVNPRKFEEVVASVFKNIGHHVYVTGYSNDGGIDVILGNTDENLIGVQVKRYKDKIKAEQIRAFAGALMLSGLNKGIFVTTSSYQPAAISAAQKFTSITLPIELIDANKFYDALKLSQKKSFDLDGLKKSINKRKIPQLFDYGWDTPRNSL